MGGNSRDGDQEGDPTKSDELSGGEVVVKRGRKPREMINVRQLRGEAMRRVRHAPDALEQEEDDRGQVDRQFIVALARGIDVLGAFRPRDGALGNSELSERTGIPAATVSRITHTLSKLGYLNFNPRFETYELGGGALALGYVALAKMSVRKVARPLMQELADQGNVNVGFGLRDRKMMILVEACEGSGLVGLRLAAGSRMPIATTAVGRAYLAVLPARERSALLDELRPQYGVDWATVLRGIEKAARDIESRGFCLSIGDWQKDINGAGVPLVLPNDGGVYALDAGGPAYMLTEAQIIADQGPKLAAMAAKIKRMMSPGGQSPDVAVAG